MGDDGCEEDLGMKDWNPVCCDPEDLPLLIQATASTRPIAPTDTAMSMGMNREVPTSEAVSVEVRGSVADCATLTHPSSELETCER